MEGKQIHPSWKKRTIVFLSSQLITLFGTSLVQMAIIWYVTLETSSGMWVTVLTLCSFLPQMVISFFAGVWADRYNRKTLILVADSVIALATLALTLFMFYEKSGEAILLPIITVSLIRSLGSGIQSPAVSAMIPQLVPEEHLMKFNGINSGMQSMVQFAAPAVAGGVMALGTIGHILLIDVATAIVSVTMLLFIEIPRHPASSEREQPPFWEDIRAGVQFSFSDSFVRKLLAIYGGFIFLSVPSGFLAALVIERTFGGGYAYLSANEIVGFAGMALGGFLLGVWGGFKNRNQTFTTGMLFYAICTILLGVATQFWMFAGVMFSISFSIPIVQSSVVTMLQEKVAPEMQGRVFGLLTAIFSGFMPLGMAIFGPLADRVPIHFLMLGTGTTLLLLAISIPCMKRFYQQGLPRPTAAE